MVDIGRRPYKTACRFLRDSDTVSEISWIEAKDDAPSLPYASGIVSLDMEPDEWQVFDLGEVFGADRTFTGKRAPDGWDGTHLCGTKEDFEEGGAYLPDLPPAEYDEQGFLACCMVPDPPPPLVPIMLSSACGSAPGAPLGVWCDGIVFTGTLIAGWVGVFTAPTSPVRFTWEIITPGTYTVKVFRGGSCDATNFLFEAPTPGQCYTIPFLIGPFPRVTFLKAGVITEPFHVKFRFDIGTCP